MTALVDWQIRERIKHGGLSITPWDDDCLQGQSYDIHLQGTLKTRRNEEIIIPPEGLLIYHGEFRLGSSVEWVRMPPNMFAKVEGKSSRAREAIGVEAAGHVDGNFAGEITLEISQTDKDLPTLLLPHMAIAQLVFYPTEMPDRPYGHAGSHYQGQRGPTLSADERRR